MLEKGRLPTLREIGFARLKKSLRGTAARRQGQLSHASATRIVDGFPLPGISSSFRPLFSGADPPKDSLSKESSSFQSEVILALLGCSDLRLIFRLRCVWAN